jgi:hypothetical protein
MGNQVELALRYVGSYRTPGVMMREFDATCAALIDRQGSFRVAEGARPTSKLPRIELISFDLL